MDVKTINNIEKAPTAKPGKLSHKKKKNVFECQKKNTGASTPYLLFRLDVQSTRVRRRDLAEYQKSRISKNAPFVCILRLESLQHWNFQLNKDPRPVSVHFMNFHPQ